MQLIKNKDRTRTLIPENDDEADILDHIDTSLGTLHLINHLQKFVDQRKAQKKYDEVIELQKNLDTLPKKERAEVLESANTMIADAVQIIVEGGKV